MMLSRPATQIPATRIYFPEEDIPPIQDAVGEILRTGQLSLGQHTRRFEEAFAAFVGVKHALAVSSGTAALIVIMRGLGIAGRDVLVPVNTFMATAAAIIDAGGRPVPVDVDLLSGSPTLHLLERARTPHTAAVVMVHIGGLVSPELHRIRHWCAEERLLLIEDAAHAHGSGLGDSPAGTIGRAGAFSMYATKVMTTGEGGMVTTADDELAVKITRLRDHGKNDTGRNFHDQIGNNWRISEIHALLGCFQLARLPAFLEARRRIAGWYDEALAGRPEVTLVRPAGPCSWYKYMLLLPEGTDKPRVRSIMRERGVQLSGDVYEVPLHRQPVFSSWSRLSFAGADAFAARHICLPIFPQMTRRQVGHVVAALGEALASDGETP